MDTYNGWTNRETWQIVNYYGDALSDMANFAADQESLVEAIEAYIHDDIWDRTPEGGIHMDIVNAYLNKVDFLDLAETFWSDRDVEEED